jgi:2'-5' RNA ligase
MRLFIAINPPKEVKDYLWGLKEEFKTSGKFNFVPKKNYHITLKFLGEIKENELEPTKQKLSKIKFKSFEDSLNKLGCFSDKVLWVDLNQKDNVLKLAKLIDQEFMEKEQRFSDHITLARIKDIKKKNEFMKRLETKITPMKFKINSFELMNSELSKDGPKYTILEIYSLE